MPICKSYTWRATTTRKANKYNGRQDKKHTDEKKKKKIGQKGEKTIKQKLQRNMLKNRITHVSGHRFKTDE